MVVRIAATLWLVIGHVVLCVRWDFSHGDLLRAGVYRDGIGGSWKRVGSRVLWFFLVSSEEVDCSNLIFALLAGYVHASTSTCRSSSLRSSGNEECGNCSRSAVQSSLCRQICTTFMQCTVRPIVKTWTVLALYQFLIAFFIFALFDPHITSVGSLETDNKIRARSFYNTKIFGATQRVRDVPSDRIVPLSKLSEIDVLVDTSSLLLRPFIDGAGSMQQSLIENAEFLYQSISDRLPEGYGSLLGDQFFSLLNGFVVILFDAVLLRNSEWLNITRTLLAVAALCALHTFVEELIVQTAMHVGPLPAAFPPSIPLFGNKNGLAKSVPLTLRRCLNAVLLAVVLSEDFLGGGARLAMENQVIDKSVPFQSCYIAMLPGYIVFVMRRCVLAWSQEQVPGNEQPQRSLMKNDPSSTKTSSAPNRACVTVPPTSAAAAFANHITCQIQSSRDIAAKRASGSSTAAAAAPPPPSPPPPVGRQAGLAAFFTVALLTGCDSVRKYYTIQMAVLFSALMMLLEAFLSLLFYFFSRQNHNNSLSCNLQQVANKLDRLSAGVNFLHLDVVLAFVQVHVIQHVPLPFASPMLAGYSAVLYFLSLTLSAAVSLYLQEPMLAVVERHCRSGSSTN
ncbi:unnamed protein product [Amoebophrya sp. A25]|nr:unnamed protein product [Amoebophrya sp. A25]|eukprot:GSA25T00002143001.1